MSTTTATKTIDYYKLFDIDRSLNEKEIRKKLGKEQQLWMKRQSSTNDTEELERINQTLQLINDAIFNLTKSERRSKYDKILEKAYKDGLINDETEAEARDALERARQYYERGQIQLAAKFALEAIENKINDPTAYEILCKCYFDVGDYSKAIQTADTALSVYIDNSYFLWLSSRLNIIVENYEEAQNKINRMLELGNNNSIANAEQIYLYLYSGEEKIAFQKIEQYIKENPDDMTFKKEVAYNLISFTNTCYIQDPETESLVIADKKSYERCTFLCKKAYEIYQDDYVKSNLDHALFFGKREFNANNSYELKWLFGTGIVMLCLIPIYGLICLIPAIALLIVSFRPYWQINRIYYTGNAGWLETTIIWIGKALTLFIRWSLKLSWWFIKFIFELMRIFC